MLTLVIGASASGKSEYAENFAIICKKKSRFYIATMIPFDAEGEKRVAKHCEMRAGKGFETIEKPCNLGELEFQTDSVYLLECMGNLLVNELYNNANSMELAYANIDIAITKCVEQNADLIIVSNDVFADGIKYDSFTENYIELLVKINKRIAKAADSVVEIVCGIPIFHKGAGNENN